MNDLAAKRIIKPVEEKSLASSLDFVEQVFAEWDSPNEGKTVRALVQEIRAKKYYLPELELLMVDDSGLILATRCSRASTSKAGSTTSFFCFILSPCGASFAVSTSQKT